MTGECSPRRASSARLRVPAAWKSPVGIGLIYGLLAVTFCSPLFEQPAGLGIMDWDEKLSYYGAVLKSVFEYGQLPFWNPWKCGGTVLWQNPLAPLLSPAYPLAAIMPLALAIKVEIALHYWLGFIGMHLLLTEAIGLVFLPLVVYLAAIFILSGSLAMHLQVGHSVFLPAFYLPWLLFFFLRAMKSRSIRDALLGGAVLALTVFNAGLHMVSMIVVAVAAIALVAALLQRSWTPIILALALGISGGIYAAPKLIPVSLYVTADQFWDTRNPAQHPDQMTWEMMERAYLDPQQSGQMIVDSAQKADWWEFGNYIGWPAVLLIARCLLWIIIKARRDDSLAWALALTALLLLTWSAGEFNAFAPASLASHLPFFSRFRTPSRFTIPFVLVAATLAGWTLKRLAVDALSKAKLFVGVLCALASLQLLVQNRSFFVGVFTIPAVERGFHLMHGPGSLRVDRTTDAYAPTSPMFRDLMNDTAFYNCYESFQLTHAADPDHPLVFAIGEATIGDIVFSPNRVLFSISAGRDAATTVLLNQNYGPGWRSTAGPVHIDKATGKPAVTLAPGQTGRFSFFFAAPGVLLGVFVMLGGAIASPFVSKLPLRGPR